MNILELCLSPSLGGLELYHLRSTKALRKTDFVLAVIHPSGRLKLAFEKEGLPFLTEKTGFRPFPVFTARHLAALIDKHHIDIIHMHWGKDLALASLSKRISHRKPRLIYTRQMKLTRSKDDFYHNYLYRSLDLMLTITDKLANEAARYLNPRDAKKVKRLYYGVEAPSRLIGEEDRRRLRWSLGIGETAFLVGLFGRIEHVKGQYLLVEALRRTKLDNIPIKGMIVGQAMESRYFQKLQEMTSALGLEQEIAFKDFVDNPQDWMQICDCVVLTTHEETFGLVLVEAMQVGVAVIGSDSGGVPEIIEHEKTGLLFRSGSSEALFRSLARMKRDPDLRESMAAAGKERAGKLFDKHKHYRMLRELMAGEFEAS
ncbi:MAG: glycosyltransferase family 4 protein [Nitrospiria bacterium]